MGFNPKEFKEQPPVGPAVSVMYTRTGRNMGDHAQDIVRMVEVDRTDTIGDVVDRTLDKERPNRWRDNPWDDFLVIRLVEPKPVEPSPEPDDYVPKKTKPKPASIDDVLGF